MEKRIVAMLVISLFKGILSYCTRRIANPLIYTEQFQPDITFTIIPYQNYLNTCPANPPYPTNPYFCLDGICQCGSCPDCLYESGECELAYPPCTNCKPCGLDARPGCDCYRDIKEPCVIYDPPAPLCNGFDCFDCAGPEPYIYFPQVEYPMSAMDIRPYYYGSCWCT